MSRPHVMQVVLSLAPGGTERLVIEICRHLVHSADLTVCCLDEPGAWADEVTGLGVPVFALGRRPGFHPGLALRIARVIRQRDVEVMHCHQYSPYVYGVLASALSPGVRLVFTEHGRLADAKPSPRRRMVNPWLARWPASIYAVSADLKQHMTADGFRPDRVRVIYNGIDPGALPTAEERHRARESLALPADAFVAGTVGRLDPVKNLTLLLAAHAELCRSDARARLVIVGDGPERHALREQARTLGIRDTVTFTGYRANVRDLMAAFDAYVNCSVFEGVSLTILEAMSAGVPVVATRIGGNPEVVLHGKTGTLVQGTANAVAMALYELMSDQDRRRRLGAAGRERVLRQFSLPRMVREYEEIYSGSRN